MTTCSGDSVEMRPIDTDRLESVLHVGVIEQDRSDLDALLVYKLVTILLEDQDLVDPA